MAINIMMGGPDPDPVGAVTGSGTTGKITKFTAGNAIGNSIISESGTTITVAGIVKVADGSSGAPSVAGSNYATTGLLWKAGPILGIAVNGTEQFDFAATGFFAGDSMAIGWNTAHLFKAADAVIVQQNGTTPQEFRVQGTTTSDKYASFSHDGTNVYFNNSGNGTQAIGISGNGALFPAQDNTQNLGGDASGTAKRWLAAYLGTNLSIGTNPAATGAIRLANNIWIRSRNQANGADIDMLGVSTDDNVYLGSTGKSVLPNGTVISGSTAAPWSGVYSSSFVTTGATLMTSSINLTNGAAASVGTLTNAPAAGNPTKWIPINDNGTTRYIPAW